MSLEREENPYAASEYRKQVEKSAVASFASSKDEGVAQVPGRVTKADWLVLLASVLCLPLIYGFDLALDQIASQLEASMCNQWQFGQFGDAVTLLPSSVASDILKSSLYTVEVGMLCLMCFGCWTANLQFMRYLAGLAVVTLPFSVVNGFLLEGLPQIKLLTTICVVSGTGYLVSAFRNKARHRRFVVTFAASAAMVIVFTCGSMMLLNLYMQSNVMDRGW